MTTGSENSSASTQDHCEGPNSSSSSSTYSETTKSRHLCSSQTTLINHFFQSLFRTKYNSLFTQSNHFQHCPENKVLIEY
jgi:hypothetical protein